MATTIGHDNLVKRHFQPPFDAAGVRRFNWHGLRHFAVSTWIEAGLTPKTVQTFAGHASLQITMDRYGHVFPSDDHKRGSNRHGPVHIRTLREPLCHRQTVTRRDDPVTPWT